MGMSDEKVLEIITNYEDHIKFALEAMMPLTRDDEQRQYDQLTHALEMIPKMRGFIKEGRREKMFRWLGFLQGVLYCTGIYSVADMAEHNRPTKAELIKQNPGHSLERLSPCPSCGDLDGCHKWQEYKDAPDA